MQQGHTFKEYGLPLFLLFIFLIPALALGKSGIDPRLKRCPPTAPRSPFLKAAPDWDTCYEFRLQRRSWRSAHVSCLEKKGRLVTIREQRIQRFLVDTMYGMRFGPRRVWIGATDRAKEMNWVWVTGENVKSGYSNWARGQPSCGITCIEDCAVMNWREAGGRWHDYHCSWFDYLPYICEYDMIPPPKPKKTTTTTTTTTTTPPTTTSTSTTPPPPPPPPPTTTTMSTSIAALLPTKPLESEYLVHGGRGRDHKEANTTEQVPSLILLGSNSAHVGQVKEKTEKSSFSTESIIFLVIGLLMGLSSGFCLLVFILFRRRRREKREEDPSVSYSNPYYGEVTPKVKVIPSEDSSSDRGHLLQTEQEDDYDSILGTEAAAVAGPLGGLKDDKTWREGKIKEFTEEEELMLGAEGGRARSPGRKPLKVPPPPSPLHQRPKYVMNTYDSPPCLAAAKQASEKKGKSTSDATNSAQLGNKRKELSKYSSVQAHQREENSLSIALSRSKDGNDYGNARVASDGNDYGNARVASGGTDYGNARVASVENHYSEVGASNFPSQPPPVPPSSRPPIPPLPVSYDVPRSSKKRVSSKQHLCGPDTTPTPASSAATPYSKVDSKSSRPTPDSRDQPTGLSPDTINSAGNMYANFDKEENLYESMENLRAAIESQQANSDAMIGTEAASYYGNVDFDGDDSRHIPESLGDVYVAHSRPEAREEEERYVPFPGDDTYKAMR